MEFKDYYKILGVESSATEDDIRSAYRKLARKYHPDVSKESDAETRMREVNEAYDVLRDKEKRQAYDNLAAGVSPDGGFQPPPGWDQGFEFHYGPGGGDDDGFSDFFSSLFGGQQRRRAQQENFRARGEDQHAAIEVDVEDALHGATREISLRSMQPNAQGQPEIKSRTLSVKIPAGVREGQFIRLAGQGQPGYGGAEPGDLYLEVRFRPHDRYRVDGRDLHMDLPVAPWEAALGATVKVPTPGGTLEVSVPPGSKAGRKLRLRGRGIPGDPPGDLYLVLDLVLPPADTEAARQAYKTLAEQLPFNPRSHFGV
ncbi:DnaJ C-terminal domain-containing protein [Bordetella avium]|uniref:Curved DNA-binding protein n=1 Tax=Bordetella avium (strain 197N) TaxID=360910 RepID=Q2KW45_BORA1|nr:DnaJ C-terminal domain-containing protein [Bordetella avium]AZY48396.1 cytochrome C biogenesis protein [Bordetella avium]AZY51775.1 cytochrome C biogenesis protein [Bordetella avium]RIQ16384.1 J domain-containing protein [Bordetella avium]RIQ31070.1 J domain-containing protein [Bordetella avium]RIQ48384.1 J domain-containing protein [Bordetella avium]